MEDVNFHHRDHGQRQARKLLEIPDYRQPSLSLGSTRCRASAVSTFRRSGPLRVPQSVSQTG